MDNMFNFMIAIQERFTNSKPALFAYQYGSERVRTRRWILKLTTYGGFDSKNLEAIHKIASAHGVKLEDYFEHHDNQLELWISLG